MATITLTGIYEQARLTQEAKNEANRPGFQGKKPVTPVKTVTVTFNSNGGTGTMDTFTVKSGSKTALPTNAFTGPAGTTVFKGWGTTTGDAAPKAAGTVTAAISANTTYYAIWAAS